MFKKLRIDIILKKIKQIKKNFAHLINVKNFFTTIILKNK